jgi:uncharacterized membrane protein YhaH (DUF805 family)
MYENSFTFRKMLAAYTKPLKFDGRSTRTELLGYLIVSGILATATNWIVIALGASEAVSMDVGITSVGLAYLVWWLPLPALAIRRLHDQDKSGWWALLLVVPTAISWLGAKEFFGTSAIIVLEAIYLAGLVLLFWKPTDGTNRYGPDPRLDPEDRVEAATE